MTKDYINITHICKNLCVDCNKIIDMRATKCCKCAGKTRKPPHKKIHSVFYKKTIVHKIYYNRNCINCGKSIKNKQFYFTVSKCYSRYPIRCTECSHKYKSYIMKGRKITWAEKIGEGNRGKIVSEESKRKIKIARLRQIIPVKDTSIEIIIQNALKNFAIVFETHKSIIGQPDIFINKEKFNLEKSICIFCDGCWWHGCEKCYNENVLSDWIKTRKIADLSITQRLQEKGCTVLRFWEHDIKNNIEKVLKIINDSIKNNSFKFV